MKKTTIENYITRRLKVAMSVLGLKNKVQNIGNRHGWKVSWMKMICQCFLLCKVKKKDLGMSVNVGNAK